VDFQNKLLISQLKDLISKAVKIKSILKIENIALREIDLYSPSLNVLTAISYIDLHKAFFNFFLEKHDDKVAFSLFYNSVIHINELVRETNIAKNAYYDNNSINESAIKHAYYNHTVVVRE